ncbi:hypothetical protein GH721_05720 [Kriegella sp. EG-1]|nr:hypothetical protein [Flavobacteriaceae bacterium EG-1]
MKIIPSRKIELVTSLSKEEVEKILIENMQAKKGIEFGFSKRTNQKLFEGTYYHGQFNIQRVINYRNSFIPKITGKISSGVGGTKIIAELKMHGFVIVFMVFWMGGVSLASIGAIYSMINNGINDFFSLIPIIMLVFGGGMVYFGFKYEADKAVRELKRIFKARIRNKTFTNTVYN